MDTIPYYKKFALSPMIPSRELRCLVIMPQITKIKDQYYPFPIGIAYISSSLKATGRNIFTCNLNYYEGEIHEKLRTLIVENNINVIMTGGLTAQYKEIKQITDSAKQIKNDIIVIIGGGIITSDPTAAMTALEHADYGVIGEGEITVCELVQVLENDENPAKVNGIVYAKNGSWQITKSREEIDNLDIIPFPDYNGFSFNEVVTKIPTDIHSIGSKQGKGGLATVCFSRSCPYNCTFCFHSSGKKYRQRSLDSVFYEIDYIVQHNEIEYIAITDELFASKESYVEEFCKRIKVYGIRWMVSMRVDFVKKGLIDMMKRSGCFSVALGLESASNVILKSMRKNISIEQIDKALCILTDSGIIAQGNFIFGDIEETYATAMETINWWKAHTQYHIKMHWITIYPGSYLYEYACTCGIIKDKVQYIKDGCPDINVSKLTRSERSEIAKLIDKMSMTHVHQLTNTKVFPGNIGKASISGNCPFCGRKGLWQNLDVFRPIVAESCTYCNKPLSIFISDYICNDIIEKNVKRLVEHGLIAIWPISSGLNAIFEKAPSFSNDNVLLVDSSVFKQGVEYYGKTVNTPDIINILSIDTVVITITTPTVTGIISTIQEKYKCVKRIIFAGDLINPDFECLDNV